MPESRPVHDPKVLRAIAHPVRNRILTELDAAGSLRAADLAALLDIPANQASFHLRQLAKYGLIEEDPDAARDRRDRVWRSSPRGVNLDLGEIEKAPGGKAASAVYRAQSAAKAHAYVERAHDDRRDEGTARSVMDSSLRLTKDEARELSQELVDLVTAWGERTRGRDDAERRTYLYYAMLMPHPDLEQEETD
ncbi:winged helix-turn-helix domain-containing protein [Nocardioides lianchengensis]|jgi:predicted ArsR family transcriptional regulator|uniref:Helix-turn-helix domain-containing protein n=1 Tax=Nocardioides lianchengensis TaxID=1045774 RepID=A0A1G6XVR1_9ACTN|nr:helix-turn-helix domain-containing protein [Nocardioides lianchengensis]NYG13462.1 putative ArsR family transcriptional regulator [Nocardioides lianchengensis]SDD82324.1 Helix-turn-helix domain-containing protein [Nocardioides lianchengensis]